MPKWTVIYLKKYIVYTDKFKGNKVKNRTTPTYLQYSVLNENYYLE